jgi:hypothetical protein
MFFFKSYQKNIDEFVNINNVNFYKIKFSLDLAYNNLNYLNDLSIAIVDKIS